MRSGQFLQKLLKLLEWPRELILSLRVKLSGYNVEYSADEFEGSLFRFFSALCDFFSKIFKCLNENPYEFFDILQLNVR